MSQERWGAITTNDFLHPPRMVFGGGYAKAKSMMLDLEGMSEAEKERICLESIEKVLEQILVEARTRSGSALARLNETFPSGAKSVLVRGVGLDPNGGTGVSKLEEECVELEKIETLMQGFLTDVRQRLALIRGETEDAAN